MQSDPLPTFPSNLLSSVRISRLWVIENDDFKSEEEVSELIARLYDYPEDNFYLFRQVDRSPNEFVQAAVDSGVIAMPAYELNYYHHPRFERDYLRLQEPHLFWEWERKLVAETPMFIRLEVKLTAKARRALEHQQFIAAQKQAGRNPIELKPNFMGLGIDVFKLLDWLRSLFHKGK